MYILRVRVKFKGTVKVYMELVYVIQTLLLGFMSIIMFAIIQFLRARANIHTALEG